MGAAVGLSRTSINNIEKGRQKILLETFCRIAKALEVAPQILLASCIESDTVPAAIDKRLQALVPKEQRWIQEGIAQVVRRTK